MLDKEVKSWCSKSRFKLYNSLQYKRSLAEDNSWFLYCPTPNWGSLIDSDLSKSSPRFDWTKCKQSYCAFWREIWHKWISWKEYRKRKGYPIDDVMFFKFIKGDKLTRCINWNDWIEMARCSHSNSCNWAKMLWKNWNKNWLVSLNTKSKAEYYSKPHKQPIHSYSAKPAYNNKYYRHVSSCSITDSTSS